MTNKKLLKGQAAILIIYVVGMVGLLIGMSLSKSGFWESLMGRNIANSTYAFYVANSGVEDAFYKIQNEDMDFGNPGPETFTLKVGEGEAKVTVSGTRDERTIESSGRYKNFTRRIKVTAFNTEIKPGFARVIHGGLGGIEFENRTLVAGRDKVTGASFPVEVFSNSYIRGRNNGSDSETDCSSPASTTRIDGNAYAVEYIERLGSGSGPCIDGNAYAGALKECRIFGTAYSDTPISEAYCPYSSLCDPTIDPFCKTPEIQPLPNINANLLKQFLEENASQVFNGNCQIGGATDCSTLRADGKRSIGDIIITGNLITSGDFYLSGPVWVKGDLAVASNQTIGLIPEIEDSSLIMLVSGKVETNSNVTFTSIGSSFLLIASEYENTKPNVCDDIGNAAIKIASNVNSILFYAMNGCASVENPTASSEFYGAIIGEGIRFRTNSKLIYDPALKNAEFFLRKQGGWQISSFTER